MQNLKSSFSGYSVDDIQKAKEFYGQTLGVEAEIDQQMGALKVRVVDAPEIFIYAKPNHQPATYTVLNFVVGNIDAAVDELISKGVVFERYEGFEQDEKGIARSTDPSKGPSIAWFKDPAGNILSVLEA
jgi:predicted enzyme related to lactoylglutathione lyase